MGLNGLLASRRHFRPIISTVFAAVLVALCGCDRTARLEVPTGGRVAAQQPPVGGTPRSAAARFPPGRLIDLTYPFDEKTIYWPTAEGFRLLVDSAGITDKGYYYAANRYSAAEHGGTHLDAPVHFFQKGQTVDQIPLERLIGPAVVVDVESACEADRDYLITVADLTAWEQQHGRKLDDAIVLLRTGFGRFWPDAEKYLGTAARGPEAVPLLHFPGLAPEAAQWLATQRRVKLLGIDTASIDYGPSTHFQSHVALFTHGIPVLENVAHLDQLPEEGALLMALPMKIGGGSGGPVRIVALIPE